MFARQPARWLVPLLIVASIGTAIAYSRLSTKAFEAAIDTQAENFATVNAEPRTHHPVVMPKIDWTPGEPWPGKWIEYPADDVLPHGLKIEVTSGVVTGVASQEGDDTDYDILGTRYVIGDVDATDITPALWRTFHLEMPKPDGSIAELSVGRPLWWAEETGAKANATIDIGLHEIGISGEAKVLKVSPCDVDSRDNPKGSQIVTGKIKHHNAEVWDLVFNNETAKPLGVTANHPIYSFDRNDWVPAGDLRIDERVRTLEGTATLTSKSKRPGRETVYNLEVHRSHAYHVSDLGILAHNSNILKCGEIAADVTKRFPIGKCEECAESLIGRLKAAGIRGQRVEIRGGGDFIISNTHGAAEAISRNGRHIGVRVGDTVYDNIHRNGIHIDDWLKDFDSIGGIKIHEMLDF